MRQSARVTEYLIEGYAVNAHSCWSPIVRLRLPLHDFKRQGRETLQRSSSCIMDQTPGAGHSGIMRLRSDRATLSRQGSLASRAIWRIALVQLSSRSTRTGTGAAAQDAPGERRFPVSRLFDPIKDPPQHHRISEAAASGPLVRSLYRTVSLLNDVQQCGVLR